MKIYKSNTGLGINVKLANGRNRCVAFSKVSDGSARFRTEDRALQEAVEKHPYYGKYFNLYYNDQQDEVVAEPAATKKSNKKAKTEPVSADVEVATEETAETVTKEPEADASVTEAAESISDEKKVIKFECFDDARDYLNENYGVAKKKLMSKVMVITEGEALGIKIEFNE